MNIKDIDWNNINRESDSYVVEMIQNLNPNFINKKDLESIYTNNFRKFWESQWFGLEYDISTKDEIISPSYFFFYNSFELSFKDKYINMLKQSYGPYLNELHGIALEYDSVNSKSYDGLFVRLKEKINSSKSKTSFIKNFTKIIPRFNVNDTNRIINILNTFDNKFWLGNLFGRGDPYLRILLLSNKTTDIPTILNEIKWEGDKDKLMELVEPINETAGMCKLNGIQFSLKNDSDKYIGIELRATNKPVLLGYLLHQELADREKIQSLLNLNPHILKLLSHIKIVFDTNGFVNTKVYFAYPNLLNYKTQDPDEVQIR